MKKSYYLSSAGQVTGPFGPGQVVAQWNNGALDQEAQVCEKGIEEWMELRYMISELTEEAEGPKAAARYIATASRADAGPSYITGPDRSGRQAKSQGLAFVLSLMCPGLGHIYLEKFLAGFAWMLLGFAVALAVMMISGFTGYGILSLAPVCLLTAILAMSEA